MTSSQAIRSGFIKRAMENGLPPYEAEALYKAAVTMAQAKTFGNELLTGGKNLLSGAWNKAKAVGAPVVDAAGNAASAVGGAASTVGNGIASGAKTVGDNLGKEWADIQKNSPTVLHTATNTAQRIGDLAQQGVTGVKNVQNAANFIKEQAKPIVREVQDLAQPVIDGIKGLRGGAPEATPVAENLGTFGEGFKDAIGMGSKGLHGIYKAPMEFLEDGGAMKNFGRVAPAAGALGLGAMALGGRQEEDPRQQYYR